MRKNTEAFIYKTEDNNYVVINPKTGKKVEEVDQILMANVRTGEFNNIQGFFGIPIVETNKLVLAVLQSSYWHSLGYYNGILKNGVNTFTPNTGLLHFNEGFINFRGGWDFQLPHSKIKDLNTKPKKEKPTAKLLNQYNDDIVMPLPGGIRVASHLRPTVVRNEGYDETY